MSDLEKIMNKNGFRFEYRHGLKYLVHSPDRPSNIIREMDEKIHRIEQLTGCTLDDLLEKFAAGWTLNPPKTVKFGDLLSMMDKED